MEATTALSTVPDALTALAVVAALGGVVLARRSLEFVDATEVRAFVFRGAYRGVLQPGINVVPPLSAETYPVDKRTRSVTVEPDAGASANRERVAYFQVVDAEAYFSTLYRGDGWTNPAERVVSDELEDLRWSGWLDADDEELRAALDDAVAEYGIEVLGIERRASPDGIAV